MRPFFLSKTWRTLDSHATPVGDICEGNAYSAYLFSQVYSEFGFKIFIFSICTFISVYTYSFFLF